MAEEDDAGFVETGLLVIGASIATLGWFIFWVSRVTGQSVGESLVLGGPLALFGGGIVVPAISLSFYRKRGAFGARVFAGVAVAGLAVMYGYLALSR